MVTLTTVLSNKMAVVHPASKTTKLGIEVPTGLTWKGWEPGKEYTKSLTLKNIQFKTQKLKFKYVILTLCGKIYRARID